MVAQPQDADGLAKVPEVAMALNMSVSHAYKLARADRLPVRTIRVGRGLRFSRRELQRLLEGEQVKAG